MISAYLLFETHKIVIFYYYNQSNKNWQKKKHLKCNTTDIFISRALHKTKLMCHQMWRTLCVI